jgi:hypothetical protein
MLGGMPVADAAVVVALAGLALVTAGALVYLVVAPCAPAAPPVSR